MVKDNSGALLTPTLAGCKDSWIVKQATVVFANETQGREWIIETDDLDELVGSN